MQDPLKKYGPQIACLRDPRLSGAVDGRRLSGEYQRLGPLGGRVLDLRFTAGRSPRLNPGNQGLHGFEITFHEAMHQWDEEIDARLLKIARDNKLKFNDLLSHAMIFYTTGEAMKTVVPRTSRTQKLPGSGRGGWASFKPALDAHWKPYLEGKTTLDEALLGPAAVEKGSGIISISALLASQPR